MSRSTQAKTKQLYSQMKKIFKHTFPDPHSALSKMVEDALKGVDKDISAISLTPHMNNRWCVFMMYGTTQNVVNVDLSSVISDIPAFINNIKLSGQSFIQRFIDDQAEAAAKEINDLINDWVTLDLKKANRRLKRIKGTASEDAIKLQERKIRDLRQGLWDLEDAIKANLKKPSLAMMISKYKDMFPLGVEAALNYSDSCGG